MNATTPTTIQGVSILSGRKTRDHDVFEIALSRDGIEVRRPERAVQLMSWDRVSEWEIEERKGYVLLTLRGQGATTPLVVPGWTLDDLELVMRGVTASGSTTEGNGSATMPVVDDGATAAAEEVTAGVSAADSGDQAPDPPTSDSDSAAPAAEPQDEPASAEGPETAPPGKGQRRLSWKVPVTALLLGVLATAVILVLLQSAGIIDWSFLGPVA